jgi:hypothetical protein
MSSHCEASNFAVLLAQLTANQRDDIMRTKLTDAAIRSFKPRTKPYAVGDATCPGHCIRITPKGVKTFAFAYRNKTARKVEWLTLGRYPDLSLTRARELANDARKVVANGGSPQTAKAERLDAENKAKTYAEVVVLYHDAKLVSLRSAKKTRQTLERIGRVYDWNDRPLSSITDDDAAEMLQDIADERGKKAAANQTKHILHTMFKCAKQPGRKFTSVNPFADLPAPGGVRLPRARFLSSAEIRQVWRALDEPERFKTSPDAATALRLILVTAARPGMVTGMLGTELRDLSGPSEHGPHWSLAAELAARSSRHSPAWRSNFWDPTSRVIRPRGCSRSLQDATSCMKQPSASSRDWGWSDGRRTIFGGPPRRSWTARAIRSKKSARCSRIPERA